MTGHIQTQRSRVDCCGLPGGITVDSEIGDRDCLAPRVVVKHTIENVGAVLDPALAGDRHQDLFALAGQFLEGCRADRIVFMDQGVIIEEGSPETILKNPSKPRTQEFLSLVSHEKF